MKKNVILSVLGGILTFISMILLFTDGTFFKSEDKSTMYIAGYGSSTEKVGSGSYTLSQTYPGLRVIMIIVAILALIACVTIIVAAARMSTHAGGVSLFSGLSGALQFIFAIVALFLPLFMGNNKTNGVSGAWHSTSTSYTLASSGVWFGILAGLAGILMIVNAVDYYKNN